MTTVSEWLVRLHDGIGDKVAYLDQPDHTSNAWESLSSSLSNAIADLYINYASVTNTVTPDDEAVLEGIEGQVNDIFWQTSGDLEKRYKTFIDYATSGDPYLQTWAVLRILDTPWQQIQAGDFPVFPGPTVVTKDENGRNNVVSELSQELDTFDQGAREWMQRQSEVLYQITQTLDLATAGPLPTNLIRAPMQMRDMTEKVHRTFADGTSPAAVAKLVDAMKGKGRGDENAVGFGRDGGSIFGGGGVDGGMFSFAEHGPAPTVPGKGGGGRGADMFGMAEKFRRSGPDLGQGPSEITVEAPQKAPGGRGGGGRSTPHADPAKPNPVRDTGSGKSTSDVHPDRPDPHPSTSTTPAGPAPNPAPTKSGPTTPDPTPAPAPVPAPADPPPTASTNPAPTPTGTGGTGSGGTGSGTTTGGSGGTGGTTGKGSGSGGGPKPEKPAPAPPPPSRAPLPGEDPHKKHAGRPDPDGTDGGGNPRSRDTDNPNPEASSGGNNPRAAGSSRYRPSDDSGGGSGRGGGPGGPRSYDAYPDPESSGGGNPRGRFEMPNPEDAVGPRGPSARLGGRSFGNWYGSGSGAL